MFINDLPKREQAQRAIGTLAEDLYRRAISEELSARDMILGCREILRLWVNGGGASTDDEVIGILGIEAQTDHVMLRPGMAKPRFPEYDDERAEIERLSRFFRADFIEDARELARRFTNQS